MISTQTVSIAIIICQPVFPFPDRSFLFGTGSNRQDLNTVIHQDHWSSFRRICSVTPVRFSPIFPVYRKFSGKDQKLDTLISYWRQISIPIFSVPDPFSILSYSNAKKEFPVSALPAHFTAHFTLFRIQISLTPYPSIILQIIFSRMSNFQTDFCNCRENGL